MKLETTNEEIFFFFLSATITIGLIVIGILAK